MVVVLSAYACASTTYYVSSSAGDDGNSGTSAATPWQTLASVSTGGVHASLIVPGTTVLLARGDVWRETLTPPSSGGSGNPIVFGAYGSGAAPEITGYQALTTWTQVSGNVWSSPVTASGLNYVLFGTIWGTKQTSQGALARDRDFYLYNNNLYVYAASNPASYYGTVAAIVPTNSQLIYVNGKSWLTFQHIKLDWFDQFGVNVAGSSDDLVFANMEADGMVPAGTLPHGFYVNASPGPGDITFENDDAHLNYDGFRMDGTASAVTLINCRGYANRDGGLVDNTGGHASYSYSHFYANNIAILNSQDVQGGVDGGNNLAPDTTPGVVSFAQYPARATFTIDDVGEAPGTEAYIDTLIPVFDARGLKLSAAVSAGYPVNTAEVQSWLNDGHDINSHSWSHQYYTNTTAMNLRYTGTGTAATVSISGNRLTTSVTGGPGGENLDIDLTNSAYSSMLQLVTYINSLGVYTASEGTGLRDAAHTVGLADVAAHDIKTSCAVQFDKQRLVMDEMTTSKAWLQTNLTGLSNVKVYVYPDGIEDTTTEGYAVTAGYEGARGGLSMGLGSNAVYGRGVNLQNIVSLGLAGLHGLTAAQIDAKVAALLFKAQVWGVAYGLFVHINDLTPTEVATLLDSITAHGGTVLPNTQLADWLHGQSNVSGTTNYVTAATGTTPNFCATPGTSGVGKGSNQGASYASDLLGAMRPVSGGWDIGAYQILWTKVGSGSGAGQFRTGGGSGTIAFQSPTDKNVDQTSAPAALLGLYGINNSVIDVTGNKIVRVSDYSMNGGSSSASIHTNSDSNDNVWSSDDKAFGLVRAGGMLYIVAWDPVNYVATPKGTSGGKGNGDAVAWAHTLPMTYFGGSGSNLLYQYTINTTSPTWVNSTGGNTNLSAAINQTQLLDISTQCAGLPFSRYQFLTTTNSLDAADRYISFGTRLQQDQGTLSYVYDQQRGCYWFDLRTMTAGGAWGATGVLSNASSILLPVPAAPTATATTGGSLTQGHAYTVGITYVKNDLGETPLSATTSVTVTAPNNAISVTPPNANPSGTISKPSGFQVYICDNTANPGCTPTLQTNGTNASGALAQPTGLSAVCSSNCSGTTTVQMQVVANNAGGSSPPSAWVTSPSGAWNAVHALSFAQVANATSYTVFIDFPYTVVTTSAATCTAGTCTVSVNTNSNAVAYYMAYDQTVPIATTPVVTSLNSSTMTAPTVNATGLKWHDLKWDGANWLMLTITGGSAGNMQSAYSADTTIFVDVPTGVQVLASNTSTPALNAAKMCHGHHVVSFGKYMGNNCDSGLESVFTLNDNSHTAETSEFCLSCFQTHATDVHFSAHMQSKNPANPWFVGGDGSGLGSHAVPTTYLAGYAWVTENVAGTAKVHKLCQNWESGKGGFYTYLSGHISPDGKFFLFSSDMGIGVGVTSGQVGSNSGAASCTDNVDCRTDAYVCVTR